MQLEAQGPGTQLTIYRKDPPKIKMAALLLYNGLIIFSVAPILLWLRWGWVLVVLFLQNKVWFKRIGWVFAENSPLIVFGGCS
jgi:hypothetical protein